ncbi:hypothetical protein [Paenibacillus sp. GYB003]|uniref:hypothetical protein n=1 Tax=Paenibacillus sp. GYB003 TaxID=2994392 RepID=UPI002F969C0B
METIMEVYRKELRRIAWRKQYKVRAQIKREVPILFDFCTDDCTASQMESRLFVKELILSLPPSKGRTIIHAAREKDSEALLWLLKYFEQDMIELSRNIRMPQEDALQSMKLELIELISKRREISWT